MKRLSAAIMLIALSATPLVTARAQNTPTSTPTAPAGVTEGTRTTGASEACKTGNPNYPACLNKGPASVSRGPTDGQGTILQAPGMNNQGAMPGFRR